MASDFPAVAIAQLWQVTLLIVLVAIVNRRLSAQRPHLAHVLWLVVLVKCLTPPMWSSDAGIFCWLQPERRVEASAAVADTSGVEWQPVEWQELLVVDGALDSLPGDSEQQSIGNPLSEAEAVELLGQQPDVVAFVDWRDVWSVRLRNVWLTMVASVLLVMTGRWWRFWRRVNSAPQRDCPELEQLVVQLARQLGVQRVRLLVTESRIGPAVVGVFRKTILLPAVVVDRLASDFDRRLSLGERTLDATHFREAKGDHPLTPILAHELLHVRRGDLWVGLLQTVAQAVWWFHPLVWWVGRATTREAERCCDEEVLAELKCDPATYARSLLDVLELKSQLAPVPVFPGVRPVDVTSKRLERIMTLRQGCRRRTPLWYWLIASVAAAITLPGAAFVVSAQDEEPQDLAPPAAVPAAPPQRQSDAQPRQPHPIREDQTLRAFNVADADSALTTHVYEIAEVAHLLSGSEAEQRQKFERLIRSREQARDAQINWFGGKLVVRTTNAGHRAVRECIAVFLGSESTARQLDEFLDSVTNDSQETLVVDLQFVTMSEESYSKVEDAVIALADREHGPDEFPLVMPAEKWDALHKDVPHDDARHYLAPQVAVFNGRTVHLESIVQHPPVTVRPVSAYRTHGGLLGAPDWLGWKAIVLPYQRDDGSFWLGMRFEVRSLTTAQDGSPRSEETAESFRRHEVGFKTTLREGQVVVLPGVNVNRGETADTSASTFLAARIRKLEPATGPNVFPNPEGGNVSRPLSGVGVNSSAGVTEQLQLQTAESNSAQAEPNPVTATKPLNLTSRQFGSWKLRLQANAEAAGGKLVILTMTDVSDRSVVSATASDVQLRETPRSTTVELMDATLQLLTSPPQFIVADKLQLISDSTHNATDPESIRLKATSVTAEFLTGDSKSSLKAGQLELTLDTGSFRITQIRGEKLESLQQNDLRRANASEALTPVVSGNGGEPEDGSWDELKQRRIQQQAERALNTSQALPARSTPGIEGALSRRTDASFQEVSLADVVKELARQHGANIVLDKRGLEEEGVSLDTRVTLEVSGISLRSVLKLILEPLNLGTKLGEDDVLIVTSQQRLAGGLSARVYAIADLVVRVPDRVSIHADTRPETVADSASSVGSDVGTRPWKREAVTTPVTSPAPQLDFEKLIELITSTVEPDSWSEVGGSGSIVANETTLSLVIRQTKQVHEEIADLLEQLRRLQNMQVSVQMQTFEVPESFLRDWNVDLLFRPLSESKSHRYMRLSPTQVAQLRLGSKVAPMPKVTLFNGQTVNWSLDTATDSPQTWHIQPVVTADRRFVRLGVGIDESRAGSATSTAPTNADVPATVPTSVMTISDRDGILIEAVGPLDADLRATEAPLPGQSQAFQRSPSPRRFLLIQPEIVVAEEEEDLLGIPVEALRKQR